MFLCLNLYHHVHEMRHIPGASGGCDGAMAPITLKSMQDNFCKVVSNGVKWCQMVQDDVNW